MKTVHSVRRTAYTQQNIQLLHLFITLKLHLFFYSHFLFLFTHLTQNRLFISIGTNSFPHKKCSIDVVRIFAAYTSTFCSEWNSIYQPNEGRKHMIFFPSIFHVIARKREINDDNNKFLPNISRRKDYLVPFRDGKFFFCCPESKYNILHPSYFVLQFVISLFDVESKSWNNNNKKQGNFNKGKARAHRTLSEQNMKSTADWEKMWNE